MTKDNLKLHLKHTAVDKKWSNRLKLSNERHIINHKIYCENIQNISCTACIAHCALKKIHFKSDMSRHHIAIEAVHLKQRNFKCLLCPKASTEDIISTHSTEREAHFLIANFAKRLSQRQGDFWNTRQSFMRNRYRAAKKTGSEWKSPKTSGP